MQTLILKKTLQTCKSFYLFALEMKLLKNENSKSRKLGSYRQNTKKLLTAADKKNNERNHERSDDSH
jgi:hypothetical protein